MQRATLLVLAAIAAMALAEGQYYVPRSYYVIDAEGHASAPVPLRRLRRSVPPYPYVPSGSSANAQAVATAPNSQASAIANVNPTPLAKSFIGEGGWNVPSGTYGSANPKALSAGQTRRQYGPVLEGRSVSASTSVGIDSSGKGYYDQAASVSN